MNSPSSRHLAILALIIANLIWGAASPIFKWSLTNISPFLLAFLRFFLASLLFLPFTYKKLGSLSLNLIPKIVIFSFLGITLNISFFFLGLKLAPSANAALIASIQPFFLILIGGCLLKENVTRRELLAALISFLGILVIILVPLISDWYQAKIYFLGNLFFLLAAIGAIGHAIVGKKILNGKNLEAMTFFSFLIGSLTFIPFALFEHLKNPQWYLNLSWPGYVGIIFGAVFSSALAYWLYLFGLNRIEASETGIFGYLMPFSAVIIGVFFFKELITLPFLFGLGLIILGLILQEVNTFRSLLHKMRQIC